jgi:hypothetical protein
LSRQRVTTADFLGMTNGKIPALENNGTHAGPPKTHKMGLSPPVTKGYVFVVE